MGGKIFKQIFTASIAFFILCCAILGVAAYRHSSRIYEQQLREEAAFVASCVEATGEEFLRQAPSLRQSRLTWVAADGGVLYDSVGDAATMENHRLRQEVQEALQSGTGESRRYSDTQRQTMLYCAVRLRDGSVVRLAAKPYSVFSLFLNLFYPLIIALVLAVGLSLLLAMQVSRSVIRPINEINLTGPDERDVYPELQPLVRRINTQNRQIRRQMEELKAEHEKQDALRREFTANVSHELKTPLTSIAGFAELMRDGVVKPEDMSRFGGKIYDESQRLITLVGDIIKLSRLESQVNPPEKTTVDLQELCQTVLSHLEHAARKKWVALTMEGEPAQVFGAESILYEMVYNLCDNAIKYNRVNGQVILRLSQQADKVQIAVQDTGIGIPQEDIDRVFERFYRVDKSHSKEVGGTGLGLSIVKHGAIFHRAAVSVDSTLGEGTTITVTFPATMGHI